MLGLRFVFWRRQISKLNVKLRRQERFKDLLHEKNIRARASAHDLRSPSTAIRAAAYHVSKTSPDIASLLQKSLERIEGIANDLYRGEALVDKNSKSFDPIKICTDLVNEYSNRGYPVRLDVDPRIDLISSLQIELPEGIFVRALSNLIENAREASVGSNIIKVFISLDGFAQKDLIEELPRKIMFAVTNTGVQVSAELISALGKKKVVSTKSARKGQERGVGLWLTQQILAQYESEINFSGHFDGVTATLETPLQKSTLSRNASSRRDTWQRSNFSQGNSVSL